MLDLVFTNVLISAAEFVTLTHLRARVVPTLKVELSAWYLSDLQALAIGLRTLAQGYVLFGMGTYKMFPISGSKLFARAKANVRFRTWYLQKLLTPATESSTLAKSLWVSRTQTYDSIPES